MENSHKKRVVSIIAAVLMLAFGFVLGSSMMSASASITPVVVQQAATVQPSTPQQIMNDPFQPSILK